MTKNRFLFWGVLLAIVWLAQACNDVGDSSAVSGEDATVSDDGGAPPTDGAIAPSDGTIPTDTGSDVGPSEDAPSGSSDTGPTADAGEADADEVDAGAPDTGAADSGVDATTPVDAGGTPDAGLDASSNTDASSGRDASSTSSADSGADASDGSVVVALVPCTAAGQTGCVQCQYNDGSSSSLPNADQVCTPTEALLVAHDIASGLAVAPGPAPESGCYACATEGECLDDSEFADTGHECEDLTGSANASACEATVACILQASCSENDVTDCYCGTAPQSGSCASVGTSNGANGACKAAEAAGLGVAATDGLDVLKDYSATTLPSGIANLVFECALSNGCTACLH